MNALSLDEQLTLVLLAPWEKRNEIISCSRNARDLVHAMPAEELFWTVKSLGPEDSGTILSLASSVQLQLFFDLDWWFKAELRPEKVAAWLLVMSECSKEALKKWLTWICKNDIWLMASIFSLFISIVKRPDDMDIQEAKDLLPSFTLDYVYYLSFKKEKLAPLFATLLGTVLEISPGFYRDVLETILGQTVSYNLETAYRFRCGRLQDFGIPDYYDSLDIYLPMNPEEMHRIKPSKFQALPPHEDMPAFVPTLYVNGFPVLESAMRALSGQRVMERIIREITGVANKVIMADLVDLDGPEDLRGALEKTFSMLNLGLEYLVENWRLSPEEVLYSSFLEEIVRVASGLILPISTKAARNLDRASARFLPYHLREQLEAASRRPAMLFDQASACEVYISTLEQFQKCLRRVDEARAWCGVVEILSPPFASWPEHMDWKKTNFLAMEEFTAEAALFTAAVALLSRGRLEVRPVTSGDVLKVKRILKHSDMQEISKAVQRALEHEWKKGLGQHPGGEWIQLLDQCLKEGFSELEELQTNDSRSLRFLKSVLVELGDQDG